MARPEPVPSRSIPTSVDIANTRGSHRSWYGSSHPGTTIGPKPCIPPMSWIPSVGRRVARLRPDVHLLLRAAHHLAVLRDLVEPIGENGIAAGAATDRVADTVAGVNTVLARSAVERVRACAAVEEVVAGTPEQGVAAGQAEQAVVAGEAAQEIRERRPAQHVRARGPHPRHALAPRGWP